MEKLQRYCVYQDRCHQEVRYKLLDLGIYGDELEEIVAELITDNFLNEERFARSFARGKFRQKRWGRIRIRQELKQRKISDYCIRKAMTEIDPQLYEEALLAVLHKKKALLRESDTYKRNHKLAQYAMRRGYEANLVWEYIRQLEASEN